LREVWYIHVRTIRLCVADLVAFVWRTLTIPASPTRTLFDEFAADCQAAFEAMQRADEFGRHDEALETLAGWLVRRYVDQIPGLEDTPRAQPARTSEMHLAEISSFLDRYRLTPVERAPADPVTAIDPEMIGRVCEHLAGWPRAARSRAESGIFYTPRVEIDLMSRLAVADWLTGRLGLDHRSLLNAAVFADGPSEEIAADAALSDRGLWPAVDEWLGGITIVDPACGSGSFLIGMFRVLEGLLARAARGLGRTETPFRRREHLVASLHGADTLAWAVDIARLRLQLVCLAGLPEAPDGPVPTPRVHLADTLLDVAPFPDTSCFDVVIGNPPYVRQESIRDPHGSANDAASRRAYKASLARSVYVDWPLSFGYDPDRDRAARPLDLKSDLYIYFFFRGLSLLNPGGVLCFITSNSWLDVGYGHGLQEFLLTRGEIRLILENRAHRSFAGADVNTAIALLGPARDAAPSDRAAELRDSERRVTRFVTLSVPFDRARNGDLWTEIQSAAARRTTPICRVVPITQAELWRAGRAPAPDGGRFDGGRWGGSYLRAPDIYWTILERSRDRLARLGDLADVRFGVKTGANPFFYLDERGMAEWDIEPRFLVPFLFSLKEVARYEVEAASLRRRVFVCRLAKSDLAAGGHTRALRYIEAGEARGFHRRPSIRGRPLWYALPGQQPPHFASNRFLGERFGFPWITAGILVCDVFFCGRFQDDLAPIGVALLNSTLAFLSAEINARKTYGIGVAYLYGPEINDVLLPQPSLFDQSARQALLDAFGRMRQRPLGRLSDEMNRPDRRSLDGIVFDALGLTAGERDAVRDELLNLVAGRLQKART
jgi:hypothetical protein